MATGEMVVRSRSMPPEPNPFWSTRARGEMELQAVRPVDPPVPLDLEMDGEVSGEGQDGRDRSGSRNHQARSREMVTDTEELGDRRLFRTPACWSSQREGQDGCPGLGLRTAGAMLEEELSESAQRGPRPTEGPRPSRSSSSCTEHDLEREVVRQLHEENMKLKKKLQEMEEKEKISGSGWSEVTAGDETPRPPPPPATRRTTGEPLRLEGGQSMDPKWNEGSCRATTGSTGTSPSGTFDIYEAAERDDAMKWLGQPMPPVKEGLFHGGCGGGMDSRWQHEDCGGGVEPRLHPEEYHRRMESRRSLGDTVAPMTAMEARTTWLERELATMKRVVEREASLQQRLRTDYWRQAVQYHDRPLGRVRGGDHEGIRAWQHSGDREGNRAAEHGEITKAIGLRSTEEIVTVTGLRSVGGS